MKYALIIANTEYTDSGLSQLSAPGKDAEEFARVLKSPEIAAFDDVTSLINENAGALREAIEDFFSRKQTDDLLLLYFSGHGVKDEYGTLYLAVKNTRRDRLRSTAIDSGFIRMGMDQSESTKQVIILDCCNSGAFPNGGKAEIGGSMGTSEAFQGKGVGRVILTASDSTQFAMDGTNITGQPSNSIFTEYLIKGIEGEADKDRDGKITLDDLYIYTYDQVIRRTPKQTPRKYTYAQEGEISIRELTEAQKKVREAARIQEQKRIEEEEKQRLETARLAAAKAAEEAIALHAIEEERNRKIIEQLAEERKRREAAELEFAKYTVSKDPIVERGQAQKDIRKLITIPRVIILFLLILAGGFASYIFTKNVQTAQPPSGPSMENQNPDGSENEITTTPATLNFSLAANSPLPQQSLEVLSPENIREIAGITRWGTAIVNDLEYSPQGDVFAAATSIGFDIYNANTFQVVMSIQTNDTVKTIAFSPDGKKVLLGTSKSGPQLWDLSNGEEITNFFDQITYSDVANAEYSPDGKLILVEYEYETIDIFNSDGSSIDTLQETLTANLADFEFSPDKSSLAVLGKSTLSLWSMGEDGSFTNTYTIKDRISNGNKIEFSSDGQTLLVTELYNSITLWRASDGLLLQSLYDFSTASFSPTEELLATATWDGKFQWINPLTGSVIKSLGNDAGPLSNLVFRADGKKILVNSGNRIQQWDVAKGTMDSTTSEYIDTTSYFAISPDGNLIASTDSNSGQILIRNAVTGTIIHNISSPDHYVSELEFSKDGTTLLYSAGGSIVLVSVEDGTIRNTISAPDENFSIQGFANSNGSEKLVYFVNNSDFSMNVVSTQSGEILYTLKDSKAGEGYYPFSIAFSDDGQMIATITAESIDLWNVETGSIVRNLGDFGQSLTSFRFLTNDLMAYSLNEKVYIASTSDGAITKTFLAPTNDADCITLSPDGSLLMGYTYDGFIHIWNFDDGTLLTSIKVGPKQYSYVLPRFSPDGKLLIIANSDGTLQFWGINP
jgi:WD40 repeat protein/uncharacterized caspase-like protein